MESEDWRASAGTWTSTVRWKSSTSRPSNRWPTVEDGTIRTEVIHRFANVPTQTPDGLHWNTHELFQNALDGLTKVISTSCPVASIGVDSWAVDYGLIQDGRLLGDPFHYRDERNDAGVEEVHRRIDQAELYQRNGLQFLPLNTLYQLSVDRMRGAWTTSTDSSSSPTCSTSDSRVSSGPKRQMPRRPAYSRPTGRRGMPS